MSRNKIPGWGKSGTSTTKRASSFMPRTIASTRAELEEGCSVPVHGGGSGKVRAELGARARPLVNVMMFELHFLRA